MKTKVTLIAALSLSASAATQAFTIDFNALVEPLGTTVTSATPLTIDVTGYGPVRFEVAPSDVVEVGQTHSNDSGTIVNSLEMDSGERILVTFLGPEALNVNFDIAGINPGEEAVDISNHIIRTNEYQVSTIGNEGSDGTGLAAVSWNVVPEPSSALLGGLGAGLLILRRRR